MAGINRVEANGEVLLDLTEDTVTPASLRSGFTAHDRNGDLITGEGGDVAVIDDDAGIGDTDKIWSADKSAREDALRAPIDSPQLTGTPTAPTAAAGTNTTQIATTAFVKSAVDGIKASPVFTGTPTAPTADISTDSTQIATTEFVHDILDYTIDDESGYEDTDKVWSADKTYSRFNEKADAVPETLEGEFVSFYTHSNEFPLKDLVVNIEPVQEGEGDPAPDNVRPITGWTSCNVTRMGKNLLDTAGRNLVSSVSLISPTTIFQETCNAVKSDDTLVCTVNGKWSKLRFGVFPNFLKSDLQYTISAKYLSTIQTKVGIQIRYNNSSTWTTLVSADTTDTELQATFTPRSDNFIAEIAFNVNNSSTNNNAVVTMSNIQLELGSTATAYEPYNGTTYPISFGEAGTVYGGSLDVTNGLLTITYQIITCNGTENWRKSGNGKAVYLNSIANVVKIPSSSKTADIFSNEFVSITTNNGWVGDKVGICIGTTGDVGLSLHDDGTNTTLSEATDFLSQSPMQLVYALDTPITYQLTPTEVQTLIGQNNIWADTGNISLTRLYDTKTFVNDSITDKIATKADVITSTISGPIASFTDGSDLGLADVNAKIEPFQDLHGYDSPWPAGFGKNIWNPEDKMYASINDSGTIEEGTVSVVVYCSVIEGKTYTVSKGTSNRFRYGFSEEIPSIGTTLEGFVSNDSATSLTFTVPEGMIYVAVYVTSDNESIVNSVQIEIGSTATDYSPYSNICPITGWTGCNVSVAGKNILNMPKDIRTAKDHGFTYTLNSDGSVRLQKDEDSNTWSYVTYKNQYKLPAGTYTFSISDTLPYTIGIYYYDPDNTEYCAMITAGNKSKTFTTENEISAIRVQTTSVTANTAYDNTIFIQLEKNSTATEIEPYKENAFPFSWETEIGTVYHGELDVATGQLTVDHISQNFTSCKSIVTGSEGKGGIARIFVGVKSREALLLCSHLKTVNYTTEMWNYRTPNSIAFRGRTTGNEICIFIKGLGTAANYNAYLSENPIQVVYEPLDPIVYQLTPTQVTTLLGENHIWADTGDVEVTYKADTKLYIDQKIAESQRATRSLLTGIETDMVATKNYVIGDLLIVGNTLYKVTANIANGSVISTETNVVATTVAEQLILLAQA